MSGSTRACSRYRWGCVLLLLGLLCAFGGQAAAKPNVIFFLTDDQGWQDLACYGHPYLKTPNFDRLAREGTRFEQFYVNASVCSPSRAARVKELKAEAERVAEAEAERERLRKAYDRIKDPVEKAIRRSLGKPVGELTKADLEKVTTLNLDKNQLTSVKGLEKLTQLTYLYLGGNKLTSVKGLEKLTKLKRLQLKDNPALTKAQITELQKALPKCYIDSNPTK